MKLRAELLRRLRHNESYLAQSIETRIAASALSYGAPKSKEWLEVQAECIREENQFLRVLLAK